MEIKSSTTAKDNKNILSEGCKYLLNRKYIPKEKAIYVDLRDKDNAEYATVVFEF